MQTELNTLDGHIFDELWENPSNKEAGVRGTRAHKQDIAFDKTAQKSYYSHNVKPVHYMPVLWQHDMSPVLQI